MKFSARGKQQNTTGSAIMIQISDCLFNLVARLVNIIHILLNLEAWTLQEGGSFRCFLYSLREQLRQENIRHESACESLIGL